MTAPHEGHGMLTEAGDANPYAIDASQFVTATCAPPLRRHLADDGTWMVEFPPIDPRDYSFNCPCAIIGITDPDD